MTKLFSFTTLVLFCASFAHANPWEVRDGSTLLDGTKTATYVAGHMFSGKDYEFTSSQVSLRCSGEELELQILGDSDFLTKAKATENPTIEIQFKIEAELLSFTATIESADWSREKARVHNGPELLEFLRKNDGGTAQVQLPVARTGVPEVRNLSLESVVETTDTILSTCGPLKIWNLQRTPTSTETPATSSDTPPIDLETQLSVGFAQKVVEELIRHQGVTLEQIVEALEPLAAKPAE